MQAKLLAFFRSMSPGWVGWSITIPVHFWRELLAHGFSGVERGDFNEYDEKTTGACIPLTQAPAILPIAMNASTGKEPIVAFAL